MPYSEKDHSKLVASVLSTASLLRANFVNIFPFFYSDMCLPRVDLHGKTAIVTGANSGIGYESARALAGMGAHVVLACRSEIMGAEAKRKIVADTGSDAVEVEILDCGSFASVRAFLDRWEKREMNQVDILINNAGESFIFIPIDFY
jgi:NADP-dependent 3-hydroxy acid dehydrogenase YdfG